MQKLALATIATASLLAVISAPAWAIPMSGDALERAVAAVPLTTPVHSYGYWYGRGYGNSGFYGHGYGSRVWPMGLWIQLGMAADTAMDITTDMGTVTDPRDQHGKVRWIHCPH